MSKIQKFLQDSNVKKTQMILLLKKYEQVTILETGSYILQRITKGKQYKTVLLKAAVIA